jgi:hypothetical protein
MTKINNNRNYLIYMIYIFQMFIISTYNYIFISLSPQLYIPGKRYSTLTVNHTNNLLNNSRFNINITINFNQV